MIMSTQPAPKGAWRITFLLFLFMLVNFADKIVVGLAGVPIMTELKLEPEQFGLLGSSFFFLFSIAAIVVGFIVNRVATRWVLLALALVWALAQFPMVGTVGFTTLLICRVILGAVARAHLVYAVHHQRPWIFASGGRLDLDPAMGVRRGGGDARRVDFPGADGARHVHPRRTGSARCGASGGRRIDSGGDALRS